MKESVLNFEESLFEDLKHNLIKSKNPVEVLVKLPEEFQNK
tara:strand:+ start:159 stop:281 length:123 start_codon:yes stop_codon:yes gene_type:complete